MRVDIELYIELFELFTVFCQIEAPGAIARLDMIPLSKSWGSGLSNGGFGLKFGQILKKLSLF